MNQQTVNIDEAQASRRLKLGSIAVDSVSFAQALDAIEALVQRGQGGAVFTPNVDHVVQAEHNARLREAYTHADISLADGMPLLWAARLLGSPLPAKVSGADLLWPLMERAAARRWRVYLMGGREEVATRASELLRERLGVEVVGTDCPLVTEPEDAEERAPVVERIRQARPDLLLVALGAPKQELWIHHARPTLGPVVALGLGASLDFLTGATKRAPPWMSRNGMEWLYRLAQEPRRLASRYLLRDPAFALILLRALREQRQRSRET